MSFAQTNEFEWRLDPDVENYPYRYRIGFEVEVTLRPLILIVDEIFDWQILEEWRRSRPKNSPKFIFASYLKGKFTDLSLGYLDSKEAFQRLREDNPTLAKQLSDGLDLTQKATLVASGPEPVSMAGRPRFDVTAGRQSSAAPGASISGAPLRADPDFESIPSRGLLELYPNRRGLEYAGPTSPLLSQSPLRLDQGQTGLQTFQLSWGDAEAAQQADSGREWRLLSNRWNQLPVEVREENIRLPLLSARAKAHWILSNIDRLRLSLRESNLRIDPYAVKPSWFLRGQVDIVRDLTAIEFRNKTPERNANTVLAQLEMLIRSFHQFGFHDKPLSDVKRDTGYHIHISVDPEDRPESLHPILEAYNLYQALMSMEAGVSPFDGSSLVAFNTVLAARGSVRLINSHRVELRAHWASPAKEVSLFLRLMKMTNQQAMAYLFEDLMPTIDQNFALQFLLKSPEGFETLITQPYVNLTIEQTRIDQTITRYISDSLAKGEGRLMHNLSHWSDLLSAKANEDIVNLIYSTPPHRVGFWALNYLISREVDKEKLFSYLMSSPEPYDSEPSRLIANLAKDSENQDLARRILEDFFLRLSLPEALDRSKSLRGALDDPGWLDSKVLALNLADLDRRELNAVANYMAFSRLPLGPVLARIKSVVTKNRGCSYREYAMCALWHLEEPENQYARRLHDLAFEDSLELGNNPEQFARLYAHYGRFDLIVKHIEMLFRKYKIYNLFVVAQLTRAHVVAHDAVLRPIFENVVRWFGASPGAIVSKSWFSRSIRQILNLMPDLKTWDPAWLTDPSFTLDRQLESSEASTLSEMPLTANGVHAYIQFLVRRPDPGYGADELNAAFELAQRRGVSLRAVEVRQLLNMVYASDHPRLVYHRAQEVLSAQGYHHQAHELYQTVFGIAAERYQCRQVLAN